MVTERLLAALPAQCYSKALLQTYVIGKEQEEDTLAVNTKEPGSSLGEANSTIVVPASVWRIGVPSVFLHVDYQAACSWLQMHLWPSVT